MGLQQQHDGHQPVGTHNAEAYRSK
jgi:hypothetical protein